MMKYVLCISMRSDSYSSAELSARDRLFIIPDGVGIDATMEVLYGVLVEEVMAVNKYAHSEMKPTGHTHTRGRDHIYKLTLGFEEHRGTRVYHKNAIYQVRVHEAEVGSRTKVWR